MGWLRMRHPAAAVGRDGTPGTPSKPTPPAQDALVDQVVIPLSGSDPWRSVPEFERHLVACLAGGPRTLVIDMSEVAEVTSSTFAELLRASRVCTLRGVDVLLRRPSPRCVATLTRVGLLQILSVEPEDHRTHSRSGDSGPTGRP